MIYIWIMRYVNLIITEQKTLEEGYKNHPKAHFRLRCQTLLLSHEGMSVTELAKITKTRTRTIYTWMDRWEQMGITGLMILKGRGVKAKLNEHDENLLTTIKKSKDARS